MGEKLPNGVKETTPLLEWTYEGYLIRKAVGANRKDIYHVYDPAMKYIAQARDLNNAVLAADSNFKSVSEK